jgi:hypothetical protein
MPPPPLKDKNGKGVIKPAADVLMLPIADKDLVLHAEKLS